VNEQLFVAVSQTSSSTFSDWHPVQTADSLPRQPAKSNLWGPIAPGWKLEYPLPLTIQRDDDGSLIVSDDVFYQYGHGSSWDAAVRDLVQALLEYRELLSDASDSPTQKVAEHLATYLRPAR